MPLSSTRREKISERIEELHKLLDEWEDYQLSARDPSESLRSEKEIKKIKGYIANYEKELVGGTKVEEDKQDPVVGPTIRRVNKQWITGIFIFLVLSVTSSFIYQRVTAVNPDYNAYLAFITQGDSLITLKQFPDAKVAYKKALEYNPKDSFVINKLELLEEADKLVEKKQFDKAERTFKLILNIPSAPNLTDFAMRRIRNPDETTSPNASLSDNTLGTGLSLSFEFSGDKLVLTISGGLPFGNDQSPYIINNLGCKDCITWKKSGINYIAEIPADEVNTLEISIQDKAGASLNQRINAPSGSTSADNTMAEQEDSEKEPIEPEISQEEMFEGYRNEADTLFSEEKYQSARKAYAKALALFPNDAHCKGRLDACDAKIRASEIAAAKNINRKTIIGGSFEMGNPNGISYEMPHQVSISGFRLSTSEVTVAQYKAFCKYEERDLPPTPPWGWQDTHPIVNVTWEDAAAFCRWVGGRLPTEAEWEYAASEGKGTGGFPYSGSSVLEQVAVYDGNSGGSTQTVRSKKPNKFGLYDMTGNAFEWCSDWYGKNYYKESLPANPKGPDSGSRKVVRGGAYNNVPTSTQQDGDQLRVTYRNFKKVGTKENSLGFRVAWD